MKKILFLLLFPFIGFAQSNTYWHSRLDTSFFAIADTVGFGANNYSCTNNNANFRIGTTVDGLTVRLLVLKKNTGAATLRVVAGGVTLSAKPIRKGGGNALVAGDMRDSSVVNVTYYNGAWRMNLAIGAGDSVTTSDFWNILGNTGTVAGTNFIGTIDSIDWVIRTKNIERARMTSRGSFGIGTTTPSYLFEVLNTVKFDSLNNTNLGRSAGIGLTSGNGNTSVGRSAGIGITSGNNNTALGYLAMGGVVTGSGNSAIGVLALSANTSGIGNMALGTSALQGNTSGSYNTAVGTQALMTSNADYNTAIGFDALKANTSGTVNTAIGIASMSMNTSGSNNNAIGNNALDSNTTGSENTAIGYATLKRNKSGTRNVALGHLADVSDTSFTNAVAIGSLSLVKRSHAIAIGDTINNMNIGIGTGHPDTTFHVVGNIKMEDGGQALGKIITSDANGVMSWNLKTIDVTTGDGATINTTAGRFRKDATGTTFTLTNSFITANSIILLQIVTAGLTTGNIVTVQAGVGSATIEFQTGGTSAAPSADADVNFFVIN